jgi:hypothetical protein
MSGPKVSSNPALPLAEGLEAARGAVRDTLGTLRNAEQLLRSVKVGPKALSSVVPLLHDSCRPLIQSWRQLCGALMLRAPECTQSLEAFVTPRIEELEVALERAMEGPVNARQRLALEHVVIRTAADLDAARSLVELMEDAFGAAPTVVDLWELTRETFQVSENTPEAGVETIRATLERGESVDLKVSPRVAMGLIAFGVKLVALDHPGVPHVAIRREPSGECGIVITRAPGQGDALVLRPPRLIPPTLPCMRAAARATQARVEAAEDHSWIALIWSGAGD